MALIGYARVSTEDQATFSQLDSVLHGEGRGKSGPIPCG